MIPYSPSYHNAVLGMSPSATLHFNTTHTEDIPMSVPLVLKPEVADYDGGNDLDQPVNTCPAPNTTFKYVKEGAPDSETTEVDATTAGPILVIVMGASESEKLMLGTALASALGLPFTDADALHTGNSIEEMNADVPDWQAWLENVKMSAVDTCEKQTREYVMEEGKNKGDTGPNACAQGVVVGSSALTKTYRDFLRDLVRPKKQNCVCSGQPCPQTCPCCHAYSKEKANLRIFFVNKENMLQRMKSPKDHIQVNSPEVEEEEEEEEEGIVVVPLGVGVEEQVQIAKKGLMEMGALRSE